MCVALYASKTGRTRKVIKHLDMPAFDVGDVLPDLSKHSTFIFFCPTYGDEELPHEMERFLNDMSVFPDKFAVCELGNYYGYDDLEFGAGKIIRHHMMRMGCREIIPMLSLDSMPNINWDEFEIWKEQLNENT